MNRLLLLFFLLTAQLSNSFWITNFEEAQKIALASNKLMMVDFTASWCGPCKEMDRSVWSNEEIIAFSEDYVFVKLDVDQNREITNQYKVQGIPLILIMDGNGKVLYDLLGGAGVEKLKTELNYFNLSTEFLAIELVHFFQYKNYASALQVYQKYMDFSLLVDRKIKSNITTIAEEYLVDAKNDLSKKDVNYIEKKQKLDLFSLFKLVYYNKFQKLDGRLNNFNEDSITEGNKAIYYFLKYCTSKSLNKTDFSLIESKGNTIEGFDFFVQKATFILKKNSD